MLEQTHSSTLQQLERQHQRAFKDMETRQQKEIEELNKQHNQTVSKIQNILYAELSGIYLSSIYPRQSVSLHLSI